ncbi:hypothetical protein [Streptomyces griseochromogenes]|uniref:hypothetical protein n=1 Tax=Streptomyces griseochromogenes TaxID=68214 RepID=UPI001331216E|nr:hypothetical protein [Streptomyces griseochromogenes]
MMLARIAAFVNQVPGRSWTVGADFNNEPRRFALPPGAHLYNSGLPTQDNGRELDYVVASANIPNHRVVRLPGSTADHYAVAVGGMRAGGELEALGGGVVAVALSPGKPASMVRVVLTEVGGHEQGQPQPSGAAELPRLMHVTGLWRRIPAPPFIVLFWQRPPSTSANRTSLVSTHPPSPPVIRFRGRHPNVRCHAGSG